MTTPYGMVIARNLRAARSRLGIEQEEVARRMRVQGYETWLRQTVSSIEKNKRRPLAEEIAALAAALETSIPQLMTPTADDADVVVDFPAGEIDGQQAFAVISVRRWIEAVNDRAVRWKDGRPVTEHATVVNEPGRAAWLAPRPARD
jgi:transcriptional regulator with XRE-family HTH domain